MTILRREIYIIDNTYVKILEIENVNGREEIFYVFKFKEEGKEAMNEFCIACLVYRLSIN